MTAAEIARLAVVESQVSAIVVDLAEVKRDVKHLIEVQHGQLVTYAADSAAAKTLAKSRGDLGVWVRASIPWLIAGGSLLLAILNAIFHGPQ